MMALAAAGSRAASLVLVYAVIAVVWGADAFIGPDAAGRAMDRAQQAVDLHSHRLCAVYATGDAGHAGCVAAPMPQIRPSAATSELTTDEDANGVLVRP